MYTRSTDMSQHKKDEPKVTRISASAEPQITVDPKTARIIVGVIASIIVLIIIVAATGTNSTKNELEAAAENNTTASTTSESAESYAEKAEKAYLEGWGFSTFSEMATDPDMPVGSNVRYINGFEGISVGTVRVYVQKDITKDEAVTIGKNVFTTIGFDMEDLDFVVVRGTDGRDVNVSRNEIPAFR